MRQIVLSKLVEKFLKTLPPKQQRQVTLKILSLESDVQPQDAKKLIGYSQYRVDSGEYRIIYDWSEFTIYIRIVGRRNDSDVYRKLERR